MLLHFLNQNLLLVSLVASGCLLHCGGNDLHGALINEKSLILGGAPCIASSAVVDTKYTISSLRFSSCYM